MRRAGDLALAGALLAACAGGGERCPGSASCVATPVPGVSVPGGIEVPFRDEGATGNSAHDGPAEIEATATGAGLRITVYQGSQRSGGYAIRVERITRAGDEVRVQAAFITPAKDALVTMALTSPAHTVFIDGSAAVVVLYDSSGAERARTRPR